MVGLIDCDLFLVPSILRSFVVQPLMWLIVLTHTFSEYAVVEFLYIFMNLIKIEYELILM